MRRHLALAFSLCAAPAIGQTLEPRGMAEWDTEIIQGLSGLEVSNDGQTFTAISDQGWLVRGTFERADTQLTGFQVDRITPLLGIDGLPSAARRVGDWSDAEGLAIAPDGRMWVAFERWARVAAYDDPEGKAGIVPVHPDWEDLPDNRQLEALAILPDGTLIAIAEEPSFEGFALYRFKDGAWDITGHLSAPDRFAIVGVDAAPDGTLYVLERSHIFGANFRSRIRRVPLDTPDAAEVLWTSARDAFGNLEGISLWQAEDGLRVTMVSDNNSERHTATQFVEFAILP